MAKESFERALTGFTLPYEGGKVNNPKDPGGKTNQGVIQRTYDAWRKAHGKPKGDVYFMTADERNAIYKAQYWDAVSGDDLPAGVDAVTFDAGVMSGPSRGIKWLQRALVYFGWYKGSVDGHIGLQTIAAAKAGDPIRTIKRECANRQGFVQSLTSLFRTFGKGWTRRIAACEAFGVAMALRAPKAAAVPSAVSVAPELDVEAQAASEAATKEAKKSTAAVTGSAGSTAAPEVMPQDAHVLRYIFIAAAIVLVIAAGVFAWRWYVNRQRAQAYAEQAKVS